VEIQLTPKQAQYIREADARWNIACGAVRSGKSHLAVQYLIPDNIMKRRGLKGLNMLFGATRENIERNVLEPMRNLWGPAAVGEINSRSTVKLFGDTAYCMGLENIGALKKIRGSEIKYAYSDELCDVHPDVFQLVRSRLSLPYSRCDASCNPEGPKHFVKKFIDNPDVDLYCQTYTLYDNPFLPPEYIRDLEAGYKGTVSFDRYILGLWKQTEGLVYPFDRESDFTCTYEEAVGDGRGHWFVSVDYGTVNPFAALLWRVTPRRAYVVDEYYWDSRDRGQRLTDEEHYANLRSLVDDFPMFEIVIDPSAGSMKETIYRHRIDGFSVIDADNNVLDGIGTTGVMLRKGEIKISERCKGLIEEMGMYRWDEKAADDRPIKEYDHAMDAMRYAAQTVLRFELMGY
jgi:PBSX family phage terminase large subunit